MFRTGWVPYNSLLNLRDPYLDLIIAENRPIGHLRTNLLSPRSALLW